MGTFLGVLSDENRRKAGGNLTKTERKKPNNDNKMSTKPKCWKNKQKNIRND